VNLEGLGQNPSASPAELRKMIGEVSKQMADLGSDVQALSHQLHSSKLEHLGLVAATESFCREISDSQKVVVDFHAENVPTDLPEEISLSMFRILQEALQNATKHSGSRRFGVRLSGGINEIQLAVSDSGIGFDPEQAIKGVGLGLTSMRERLKIVNGDLFIQSQPQLGTTIYARVPLTPRMKSAGASG